MPSFPRSLRPVAPWALSILLLACEPLEAAPSPVDTSQPVARETATAGLTALPTALPAEAEPTPAPAGDTPAAPIPAATAVSASVACPTPAQAAEAGPAPVGLPGVIDSIPAALEERPGDLGALCARLGAWGALETGASIGGQPSAPPPFSPLREADVDGDGTPEVLLLLAPPGSGHEVFAAPAVRALAVLRRSGGGYTLAGSRLYDPAFQLDVSVRDLTGDGRPELLVTYQDCGAHTCFLYVDALAYGGGELRSLFAQPATMSYADLRVEDGNGDGKVEIALHGGEIGSVGAGPVQTRTDAYAWNGQAFELAETRYDPSDYRLHVLYDGDRALRRGDLAAAQAAYSRAASDAFLRATGVGDDAQERRTLEAFAWYRLVTVQAALGDGDGALKSLEALRSGYADHPAAALAGAFWAAYQPASSLAGGCAAATAYAGAHPEVVEAFGYYGYGNPPYAVEDLCFLP